MQPNPGSWQLSCPDWRDRLRSGRSLVPTLPLNDKAADTAVAVFNKLRLADVPGTPTMAEAGGEWFRDIVRAIFGSVDPVTRQRMIRELFLLVSKKNSKTTNGALLMVTALLLNERPRANFILTAPVQDVTEIAFAAAAGAIALDPVLEKKLHVREHLKTIVHRESKAELQIMTFDPSVLTGQKASGVLIDELHVVAKMSKAASAIRQLRGGMVPFPEAFLAFITTQSEDAPSGVFKAELAKARAIRDGEQIGSMLPVLYEFPEEMQRDLDVWQDPVNWHMVTPNAGRSVTIPRLVEDFNTAQQTGDDELRAWASQHLNVEIGLALHADRWAGADYWEAAEIPRFTLTQLIEDSEVLTIGIDGGGLDDLLGLTVIGRVKDSYQWRSWSHAWAHASVLERRKSEAARLRDFVNDGDLTIVESVDEVRQGEIPKDVLELAELCAQVHASGKMDRIGVDPYAVGMIIDALNNVGIEGGGDDEKGPIVAIPQGWKLVRAIKTAERRLEGKGLRPCDQPIMRWSVGNAKAEPKGNAIAITKQAAGKAKIDPLMSTFNAVELMSLNPQSMEPQLFT